MSQIMYNYPAMLAHAGEMASYACALHAVGSDVASEQAALSGAWQGDTGPPGRGAEHAINLLAGYSGIVQCDSCQRILYYVPPSAPANP